jgi:ubiquitin
VLQKAEWLICGTESRVRAAWETQPNKPKPTAPFRAPPRPKGTGAAQKLSAPAARTPDSRPRSSRSDESERRREARASACGCTPPPQAPAQRGERPRSGRASEDLPGPGARRAPARARAGAQPPARTCRLIAMS